MIRLLAITMILANAVQPVWAGELIEIQLMHKLDDLRGFYIDIRGHKERAKVKKGSKLTPATHTRARSALTKLLTQNW